MVTQVIHTSQAHAAHLAGAIVTCDFAFACLLVCSSVTAYSACTIMIAMATVVSFIVHVCDRVRV